MTRARAVIVVLASAAVLGGCNETPPEVGVLTEGSTGSASTGASTTGGATAPATGSSTDPDASSGPGSGEGSGTTSSALDSTGTSSGTTAALEDSGSSTTGEVSPVGCADGSREALFDEALHPNVAACAGGFWLPGVASPVPLCDRQGGNDGPLPDGMGCSIADLCAEGWHLCTSRHEVMAAGLAGCGAEAWGGQFFATGQSGEGANACNDTGTNDVFGCGDVGYTNISGCAPLNRSTGNLCVELPGAWGCGEDAYAEATQLNKTGPGEGGALCCRDAS